jgi:hypothetical protein
LVVDGIQGGTWPQVHLLGTAALERFTGYTGQSRSRHATHTWNVTRLPEIDFGGVLADQRTPDREVLDALRRLPDTGFALHDDPDRIGALLAERAEHHTVLAARPPERLRHLRHAERQLDSARKHHQEAAWRLDRARHDLGQLGGLSQLRRRGRQEKATLLGRIERFEGDLARANDKVADCEADLDHVRGEFAEEIAWEIRHGWRSDRLAAIENQLAELRGDRPTAERGVSLSGRTGSGRLDALFDRHADQRRGRDALWADRLPELAAPPLPGRDPGHGIDLGL